MPDKTYDAVLGIEDNIEAIMEIFCDDNSDIEL